jgi:hypothetical protein
MSTSLASNRLTAMFIPGLQQFLPIGSDHVSNGIQFLRLKTTILAQSYWAEPEFANELLALYVYMFQFVTIEAVKVTDNPFQYKG